LNSYVIDASVAVKWFFEEEHTDAAERILDDANRLHAPDFLLLEADNVVAKRLRRREIDRRTGNQIRRALRRMPLQFHPFAPLLEPAFEIATITGRSQYDCLYVALAELIDAPVITADRRLLVGLATGPFADVLEWVGDI
jgi:predicted nucleic acid-binding protein